MEEAPIKIGMRPPHPGSFVRDEILEELGLSIARAAEIRNGRPPMFLIRPMTAARRSTRSTITSLSPSTAGSHS